MIQFHPVPNKDYQKLRHDINYIAYSLGIRLERNPTYDERGLTDELLNKLQELFSHSKLSSYYINLHVHKPSEKSTGADILLRIKLNEKDISFDNYVLIQAKKYLKSKSAFSETDIGNKHLSGQVAKMHSYNPEFSYILFYATTEEPKSNIVINGHQFELLDLDSIPLFYEMIGSLQLSLLPKIDSSYPVSLLRSKTWEKFLSNKPDILLSYSETFPSFLLDDVITGKLGKEWHPEIERAQGEFSFVVTISIGQG